MRLAILLSLLAALALPGQAQPTARAWQGTIDLPTYELGPEDPYAPFPLVDSHNVYPYTMLDDLSDHREVKQYRAIFLENEYLKAIILPDVGGRLYSLYDKQAKREVFYRNHVVKYGLVALRGAWISGGIEFNFPNGHTTVTVSPVDARVLNAPDGSATAVVGGLDRVTGMHWEIWLTLRPGQAFLEQKVILFNSTALPQLYWFWANAAVPATQDMQFIYPMREVNPHSHTEIWTYPVWQGVDYSWYRNFPQPTSLFGLQVQRNFFGAYYHAVDYGVVHVADFRQNPGKKIWSWGRAGDGLIWTRLLTDDDGPYNEIQSGRYETQLSQEFLPAGRVESWTEYWYPVDKLGGGFVEATPELALNVNFVDGKSSRVEVLLAPVVRISGVRLRVRLGAKLLRAFAIPELQVGRTEKFSVPVEQLEAARKQLAVEVTSSRGDTLLRWSAAEPVDGNTNFISTAGVRAEKSLDANAPAGELFQAGVREEQEDRPQRAERFYEHALAKDPGYVPALLKLAERDYRAADFAAAEKRIAQARERDSTDPRTNYLAGIVYRAAGQTGRAQDAFWSAIHFGGARAPALQQLGEVAISEKRYDAAEDLLRQALRFNPDDAVTRVALAVALRLDGKRQESHRAAEQARAAMPILPFALAEASDGGRATPSAAEPADGLRALGPRGDVDTYLSVAAWYRGLGDLSSSDALLKAAAARFAAEPLVYDYLASNAWKRARDAEGARYATQAAAASYTTLFPHRVADALVLSDVLAHRPQDKHALLLLGDFLFARGRYDEAAAKWRGAAAQGLEDAALQRNLGVWAWRVKGDRKLAATYYEKAIQLAPQQYRLYPDLDEIYAELGDNARREKLYATAPATVLARDVVRVRQAFFLVDQGQFEDALAVLRSHTFKPWEGGQVAREVYVLANLELGRQQMAQKAYGAAEKTFRQALEYPAVLGVGKPDRPHDEEAQYWLGESLNAQGKTEAARAAWRSAADSGKGGEGNSALFRAAALQRLGNTQEAEQELSGLAKIANEQQASAQEFCIAGRAQRFLGQLPAAEQNFREALKRDPGNRCAQLEMERKAGRNETVNARH
jgi:tetratricopeptide (TPR) repeat protein